MPKVLKVVALVALCAMVPGASPAGAQTVALYGEFHESNGPIFNVPLNPPVVACVPPPLPVAPPPHVHWQGGLPMQHLDLRPTGVNDARCHAREQHAAFTTAAEGVFNRPRVGSRGARNIDNPAGGLAVGDPFTIPPFAFRQELGPQVGVVLDNAVRQIDTTFVAVMPGIDRNGPNPGYFPAGSYTRIPVNSLAPVPALTRMFSPMNWQNPGNGWNNGRAVGLAARANANTTHVRSEAQGYEKVRLRYVAGPRQFGGTMALLLDGKGRRYVQGAISRFFPASLRPTVATWPLVGAGDTVPGFRRRAGIGWNLTIPGAERRPRIKAFQGHTLTQMGLKPIIAPRCTTSDPLNLLPVGCNLINGFDTYMNGVPPVLSGGTFLLSVPGAASVKHVFGLTTGTVSIVVLGLRGTHFSTTLTGMGYDTAGLSSMGGLQRNVGLVAGSYTVRVSNNSTTLSPQLLGIDLKFTPEPGATAALVSGLGALGTFALRRLRPERRDRRRSGGQRGRSG